MKRNWALAAIIPLLAHSEPAFAQSSPAAPAEDPICTDRPTKANLACTVPAGRIQVEADAVNWTTNQDA